MFPGKRRLKLSRGETLYFRWTQFGIQSLRGCLFLLFGSTLVVKIKKTQESTPRFLKRITEDKENIILPFFTTGPHADSSRIPCYHSRPRPGWAPDPLMVGIRSPDGLVVGSCTSHPGVLGSIPKREEPGKTGAPCVKVPGSSRVPGSSSLIAHVLHSPPPPTRTAL